MNLSKGKIGEDNADLLGALLVSRIQFFALQRAKIPSQERRPFYLYVDEFQNFATGSFESILSESRKYGLGLYLTHQYTAQLPEDLLKAVLGNVGTIIAFALGTPDAKALQGEFAPYFTDTDIISLERFHVYIKLMMDGMTSLPFSAKILRPWVEDECIVPKSENKQWVLELSRQKYGIASDQVEDKIRKWVDTRFDKGMAISLEAKGGVNSYTGESPTPAPAPVKSESTSTKPPLTAVKSESSQIKPVPANVPDPRSQPNPVDHPKQQTSIKSPNRSTELGRPSDKAGSTTSPDGGIDHRTVEKTDQAGLAQPIQVLASGMFDGIKMITETGQKYSVQPNYAAKSELVYGDKLEYYKEGDSDRFRQAVKVPRLEIEGVLQRNEAGYWGLVTKNNHFFLVSQTAVQFNEFIEGQKMYGIIPADLENPPFCTLALKKYRREIQKQEEAQKAKVDQSLR